MWATLPNRPVAKRPVAKQRVAKRRVPKRPVAEPAWARPWVVAARPARGRRADAPLGG